MEEYKVNLLKLAAKYDLNSDLHWHTDLRFFINCSDVFAWGFADGEEVVSQEDVDALEQAALDCKDVNQYHAGSLFVARKRKMRPQGAMYEHINKELHALFDACGPERVINLGNPKPQP